MSLVLDPPALNQPNPLEQLLHLLKARVADLQQQAESNPEPNPDPNPDSARLPSANEISIPRPTPAPDLSPASLPALALNLASCPAPEPKNQTFEPNPVASSETVSPQPTEAAPPPQSSDAATQSPQYVLPENPAVEHCVAAWNRILRDPRLKTLSGYDRDKKASHAFCDAMSPPVGRENIRDFVACVTKAMLIGAIEYNEGPKLLYAAQIASSACEPRQPLRQPGRPRASEATAPPAG